MKTVIDNKAQIIYHGNVAIYKYEDNYYSYDKYPQRFLTLTDCLIWGKAMDSAIKKREDALKKIKQLETDLSIVAE